MNNINQLDRFEIPNELTDADAEYTRIKLTRCTNDEEVDKYREQLRVIEERLLASHNKKLRNNNVKKTI